MSHNDKHVDFSILKNKIITSIKGLEEDSNEVIFTLDSGDRYKMYHDQDCCEQVSIDDIEGNIRDLLDTPILYAEEVSDGKEDIPNSYGNTCTWTFYKLATVKGYVTIKWYGTSNGYYSESVSFIQLNNE